MRLFCVLAYVHVPVGIYYLWYCHVAALDLLSLALRFLLLDDFVDCLLI